MQSYKAKQPCPISFSPKDPAFSTEQRLWQGCPTIAVTRGGRIFASWYSGGDREPHPDNYSLLVCSDDGGQSWSAPLLVIQSDRQARIQALDIELFTAPDGRLYVFWVQNDMGPAEGEMPAGVPGQVRYEAGGFRLADDSHAMWCMTCDDPDAAEPRFSAPRYLGIGFLRNRPTVLRDGRWLLCNYDQLEGCAGRYNYSVTDDGCRTLTRRSAAKKLPVVFDESMIYEDAAGRWHLLARSVRDGITECVSPDGGQTWSETRQTGFSCADSRFYVGRTPGGRLLLVHNDCPDLTSHARRRMTLRLSEDDGATWTPGRCLDEREPVSYPDVDFRNGEICVIYDYDRNGAGEILFARFPEEALLDPAAELRPQVISHCKKD